MVKTKQKCELKVVFQLNNKGVALVNKGRPMDMISSFFIANVPNYVFVEAHKKEHVQQAISDIKFIAS